MVAIAGKYQLVETKNWYEFMIGLGLPEARAKEVDAAKGTLEITVDGDKVTFSNSDPKYSTTFIVGEEIEENLVGAGVTIISTIKIDGNVVKIDSKRDENTVSNRTYTFSDTGLEGIVTATKDGKTWTATRIYKRI